MTAKRKTPYQMLLEVAREWAWEVEHRREVVMWTYPKASLDANRDLRALYERTQAAKQLGYDVHLEADDTGLRVRYKKQIPPVPVWFM